MSRNLKSGTPSEWSRYSFKIFISAKFNLLSPIITSLCLVGGKPIIEVLYFANNPSSRPFGFSAKNKYIAAIQCMVGKGRTSLMVCAYLVYTGMTVEEAFQLYA